MKKIILTLCVFGSVHLASKAQTKIPADIEALLTKNTCLACHKVDVKLVGPSYKEIMRTKKYTAAQIVELIYKPKPEHWPGYPAMVALPSVPKAEAMKIATWLSKLK